MPVADSMFMVPETREQPMHVGGLQVFEFPEGAGREHLAETYRAGGVGAGRGARLPPPAVPLAADRRAVGLARGRRDRPRAPRAPLRAARAGPRARAAGADLAPARDAAGPQAPAVGGAPHRGPRGRPLRRLHEDAPRDDGRRLGAAAAPAQPVRRPRRARHPAAVGALLVPLAPAVAVPAVAGPRPARAGARAGRRRRRPGADAARAGPGRAAPPGRGAAAAGAAHAC